MEHINDAYARYADENHDLAVSLTARELGLEECRVREVVDAGESRNIAGLHPRVRAARLYALRRFPVRFMTHYPTLG